MQRIQLQKNNIQKTEKGFAMLFAVLTASLMVAIGISIFSISLKELQIATSERDSQAAYYAADSAQECAIYWDLKMGAFPTCLDSVCTPNTSHVSTTTDNTIMCNGKSTKFAFDNASGLAFASSTKNFFKYSLSDITMPASDMSITKQFIAGSPDRIITTIITQGHNTGITGRRVERGIIQSYNSN